MRRRRILVFSLIPVLLILGFVASRFIGQTCDFNQVSDATPGNDMLRLLTQTSEPTTDFSQLVEGNAAFGFDLYHQLAEGENGNILYSPYSISLALAMAYAGARGETEQQIANTLHFTLPQSELHPMFAALNAELANRAQPSSSDVETPPLQLNIANALWGQVGTEFNADFLQLMEDNYGGALRLVDYVNAPDEAVDMINEWVAQQTQERIPHIIDSVGSLTRLILTNAIYFNGAWSSTFIDSATHDDTFTLLDGSSVTVPMMTQQAGFPYRDVGCYQILDMPYGSLIGDSIAMRIFLPDAGQFEAFENSFSAQTFDTSFRGVQEVFAQVTLFMPRFEYEFAAVLTEPLADMGMTSAFDASADFSGISDESFFISDVLHKAFISVSESGTEATAVTATTFSLETLPSRSSPEVELHIDRPFIFTIYDRGTGAILFIGRVLNPAAE
jgi:serpin B